MTEPEEIENVAIVVLGVFNPAILHPSWLASQELVRSVEAESAVVQLVHPDAAIFSLPGLQVQMLRDRFIVSTEDARKLEVVRDLVVGVLDVLSQTPTKKLGINVESHFEMTGRDEWHALGHRLAPKEPWDGILSEPGLMSLQMKGRRPDDRAGHIQVGVGPSPRLTTGEKFGAFARVNDHFDIAPGDEVLPGTADIRAAIGAVWTESIRRSRSIISKLKGDS